MAGQVIGPLMPVDNNGQYSQSHHASRDEIRNSLEGNRVVFLDKADDFWGKILLINPVPPALVEAIRDSIQAPIHDLVAISGSNDPLEDDMYPPLEDIFIALGCQKSSNTRFWKDYHTKHLGVDSGVLIDGLGGKRSMSMQASSMNEWSTKGHHRTRRRKGDQFYPVDTCSTGESSEDRQVGDDDNDYRFHETPVKRPNKQRVFDAHKPDYVLLDANSGGKIPKRPLWRQAAVMVELKPQSAYAPSAINPESSLIVQCVDYARLHMALRPFQRFSILFTLCGKIFTAWLIDRIGVIISDNVDISDPEGVDTFIRALIQVTCNMSEYELGMDPTISLHGRCAMGDADIPRFEVTMPSEKVYLTRGIPVWQSSSVFGRGTVVWNVEETVTEVADSGPSGSGESLTTPLILKTAYRSEERIGESEFYRAIQGAQLEGLAVFREGGDVYWSHKQKGKQADKNEASGGGNESPRSKDTNKSRVPVAVSMHRSNLRSTYKTDSISHRLVLESRGERLSNHVDLVELLKVILSAIKGHEALHKLGILHRDISIGNVFISTPDESSAKQPHGFLADLDMAKVYDKDKLAEVVGQDTANELVRSGTGSITGTAQFMALSLLKEHARAQERKRIKAITTLNSPQSVRYNPPAAIKPMPLADNSPHGDLESFVWVTFYALCIKEMNSKPTKPARDEYCKEWFAPIFGAVSFQDTYNQHNSVRERILEFEDSDKEWRMNLFPNEDAWFVIEALMRTARDRKLDYEEFRRILEFYIGQLESAQAAIKGA